MMTIFLSKKMMMTILSLSSGCFTDVAYICCSSTESSLRFILDIHTHIVCKVYFDYADGFAAKATKTEVTAPPQAPK